MRYLPPDHEQPLLPTKNASRLAWWAGEVAFLATIDHLPPLDFCKAITARKGQILGQVCGAAYRAAFDATPAGLAVLAADIARLEADIARRGPSTFAVGAEMDDLTGKDLAPYWRARIDVARALAAQFEAVAA